MARSKKLTAAHNLKYRPFWYIPIKKK